MKRLSGKRAIPRSTFSRQCKDVPLLLNMRTARAQKTPRKCAFCEETANLLPCAWPTLKYLPVPILALTIGDRVKRLKESPRRRSRPPAVVSGIEDHGDYRIVNLKRPRRGETGVWARNSRKRVLCLVPAPCDTLCCESHRAERGAAVHCQEHWHAWRDVA
jgi:hypothetical protein